ncbi:MAG UNVERIFIED_CONTAM: hypothetical protein LVT10_07005 [Anaerolineae bacterium]|jgi:hypothetical protein
MTLEERDRLLAAAEDDGSGSRFVATELDALQQLAAGREAERDVLAASLDLTDTRSRAVPKKTMQAEAEEKRREAKNACLQKDLLS